MNLRLALAHRIGTEIESKETSLAIDSSDIASKQTDHGRISPFTIGRLSTLPPRGPSTQKKKGKEKKRNYGVPSYISFYSCVYAYMDICVYAYIETKLPAREYVKNGTITGSVKPI